MWRVAQYWLSNLDQHTKINWRLRFHLSFLSFFLVCLLLPTYRKCRELITHTHTHTHTLTHTKLGRTPLNEWSAHRRDFCFTTHNIHKGQTSMPLAEFEPVAPVSERPQIYALNRAAPEICWNLTFCIKICLRVLFEVYAILILVIFSLFGDNSGPLSCVTFTYWTLLWVNCSAWLVFFIFHVL